MHWYRGHYDCWTTWWRYGCATEVKSQGGNSLNVCNTGLSEEWWKYEMDPHIRLQMFGDHYPRSEWISALW